jgi:hypothetical protein
MRRREDGEIFRSGSGDDIQEVVVGSGTKIERAEVVTRVLSQARSYRLLLAKIPRGRSETAGWNLAFVYQAQALIDDCPC